mmetsp:Transcript_63172/g.144728  ORF Transcript_63172/g.144728 Transcript_63172/m.144728 type:complete len:255 (-) Transcript_63172:421-1185(-)
MHEGRSSRLRGQGGGRVGAGAGSLLAPLARLLEVQLPHRGLVVHEGDPARFEVLELRVYDKLRQAPQLVAIRLALLLELPDLHFDRGLLGVAARTDELLVVGSCDRGEAPPEDDEDEATGERYELVEPREDDEPPDGVDDELDAVHDPALAAQPLLAREEHLSFVCSHLPWCALLPPHLVRCRGAAFDILLFEFVEEFSEVLDLLCNLDCGKVSTLELLELESVVFIPPQEADARRLDQLLHPRVHLGLAPHEG